MFTDKTVVLTGAGSGIGRALAQGFCADGANVIGIGRTAASLEETARLCGPRMTHFVGNVADPLAVDALFSEARRRFGSVDILVNNAALYPKKLFLDPDFETWVRALETNVLGMALCCRAALPPMLERGFGRILNVGSFAWKGPIPLASAYSVSKAAVHALTRSIAVEIDRDRYPDVLVNEFLPGIVRTSMSDTGIAPEEVYPHARKVAGLPRGGPTGRIFLQSELFEEHGGRFGRVRRMLSRVKSTFRRAS